MLKPENKEIEKNEVLFNFYILGPCEDTTDLSLLSFPILLPPSINDQLFLHKCIYFPLKLIYYAHCFIQQSF